MVFRALELVLIIILGIFVTPILSVPVAFHYAMRNFAPELLLLGYIFDTYFGSMSHFPYYLVGAATLVFVAEIAKRFLMIK